MMKHLLDNIVWHTLRGPHAEYTTGTDEVRRYVQGFSPFVGFAEPDNPKLSALALYVEPGEFLYCEGWAGVVPRGWRIASEYALCKMIWEGILPVRDEVPEAVLLDSRHAYAALDLANLTRPGPFSLRTIELGEYFGIFEHGRLVAMAGARTCAAGFAEISGVCTRPELRGRGIARSLILKLVRRQVCHGKIPFLRVMCDNDEAHRFYRRMGFRDCQESVARKFSRCE